MHRISALLVKELRTYLNSAVAYLVVLFFVLSGSIYLFYVNNFLAANVASLRSYFGFFSVLCTLIVPALTMRTFAEERREGTAELLYTLPIREHELVLGKFSAVLLLLIITLLLTLPLVSTVTPLGHFDSGEIAGEYIGILLLSSAAASFGIFVSSLSGGQIGAFIVSVAGLFGISFLGDILRYLQLPDGMILFMRGMSFQYRFQSFVRGVVDTRDLAYFMLFTVFFLYGTVKVLEFRRWR